MISYIWLVPLLPLAGALITGALNKRISGVVAGTLASASVLGSFIIALASFFALGKDQTVIQNLFTWISAGSFNLNFSFQYDALSALMLLIVTGVGFLIHVYSIGYMHHDEDMQRFFCYLNLFVFFMLLLVLGSNYIVMFTGWEGVGLCSYLLIGFWFKNSSYSDAAKKAFIMNRIGDLGFLLGLFMLYIQFGSFEFGEIFVQAHLLEPGTIAISMITLFLFIGAMGKSAQIPLYTWLPDAMAGPTPVSALIHAATMVTAGIYMIVRSNILFTLAPETLQFIGIIGAATAFLAATIGLVQNDIKKVLAYSTVSQLGFMFAAIGVGAYSTAMFHVTTHAFFKALLFLGAGSVIHAMSGEQDIRKMGGLRKALPITHLTFLIGTLAIAGIPPLSGFFSKDEILAKAFENNLGIYIVLMLSAMMTAFYMFRLYFLTFSGGFRGNEHQKSHLHESPISITLPLAVLAVLSVVGGWVGIPAVFGGKPLFTDFLASVISITHEEAAHLSHNLELGLMGITMAGTAIMFGIAYSTYVKRGQLPPAVDGDITGAHKLVYNKYYVDEAYDMTFVSPIKRLGRFVWNFLEMIVIDGIVNFIGFLVTSGSAVLRYMQNGSIGYYLFAMVIGVIILFAIGFGIKF